MTIYSELKRTVAFCRREGRLPTIREAALMQSYLLHTARPKPPEFAQIEPTTQCNLNCRNCSRRFLPEHRKGISMQPKRFGELLDRIPSLKQIHLQGLGEPLLTPDLQGIIDLAKARGIRISTTTNGSLLHVGKYLALA